jgi:hypothetical protein
MEERDDPVEEWALGVRALSSVEARVAADSEGEEEAPAQNDAAVGKLARAHSRCERKRRCAMERLPVSPNPKPNPNASISPAVVCCVCFLRLSTSSRNTINS